LDENSFFNMLTIGFPFAHSIEYECLLAFRGKKKVRTLTLMDIVVKFILVKENECFCSRGGKLKNNILPLTGRLISKMNHVPHIERSV